MDATFEGFPTIDDVTSEAERTMEQVYWQRLRMADEYAEYVEREAVAMAEEVEEDGDEPTPPPAPPLLRGRQPATPLWVVLLAGAAGRIGQTRAESRDARRKRRVELDHAA